MGTRCLRAVVRSKLSTSSFAIGGLLNMHSFTSMKPFLCLSDQTCSIEICFGSVC